MIFKIGFDYSILFLTLSFMRTFKCSNLFLHSSTLSNKYVYLLNLDHGGKNIICNLTSAEKNVKGNCTVKYFCDEAFNT